MVVVGVDWYSVSEDVCVFFFQAEDGIRDLVRSRGLGDVYKRQVCNKSCCCRCYLRESSRHMSVSLGMRNSDPVGLHLSLIHI